MEKLPGAIPASSVTNRAKLLLKFYQHDFIFNMPSSWQNISKFKKPESPIKPADPKVALFLLLKYILPRISEIKNALMLQPRSEKPAYFALFPIFATVVHLASGAKARADEAEKAEGKCAERSKEQGIEAGEAEKVERKTAEKAEGKSAKRSKEQSSEADEAEKVAGKSAKRAKEQGLEAYADTEDLLEARANVDPGSPFSTEDAELWHEYPYVQGSTEKAEFVLVKQLITTAIGEDPERIIKHVHEGKVSPALDYEKIYEGVAYAVLGILRNKEKGKKDGCVTVTFGNQEHVIFLVVQEVTDPEVRRKSQAEGNLTDQALEQYIKLNKAATSSPGKRPKRASAGDTETQAPRAAHPPLKRTTSEGAPKGAQDVLNIADLRPPREERSVFKVTFVEQMNLLDLAELTPREGLRRFLQYLLTQCAREALQEGLPGVIKSMEMFEKQLREREDRHCLPQLLEGLEVELMQARSVEDALQLLCRA